MGSAGAVVLLGPQRFGPTVAEAVRSLAADGPVATVTAGWQEREPDDAELSGLLDGRAVNLGLYGRWLDVVERDPEFAAADRHRRDVLDELQATYLLRLHHAVEAVYELERRAGDPRVREAALADAIESVRALDARHLERLAEVHAEFDLAMPADDRPVVAEHRAAVARAAGQAAVLAVAGGHVGVLLACLRLFAVAAAVPGRPVVAWSAGAMALAETVVLFGDRAVHGRGHAEVHDRGLGLCRGVVPLPHARRRLRTGDRARMSLLARRFAPARCLVLDDGARADCPGGAFDPPAGVLVGEDGRLTPAAA